MGSHERFGFSSRDETPEPAPEMPPISVSEIESITDHFVQKTESIVVPAPEPEPNDEMSVLDFSMPLNPGQSESLKAEIERIEREQRERREKE
jgi:hypothetical protein